MFRLVCCLLLFTLTPTYTMRRTPVRPHASQRSRIAPICRSTPTRMPVRLYGESKKDSASNPQYQAFPDHEADSYIKRQEAWSKITLDVAQRVSELKAKGQKHRGLASQHTNYARAYETLAELEKEKLEVFRLTINKLNASALDFGSEPNIEQELNLTKLLAATYEEFYNALPEDEKNN